MGICAWELSAYLGRTATEEDMKNLSEETAGAIFKKNYWDKFRGDEIINQNIANDLFDACVNEGLVTGIKQAQEAGGITINGKVDEPTLNFLNTLL